MFGLDYSWILFFLPLMLIPFFASVRSELNYSSIELLPTDRLSGIFEFLLKLLTAILIGSILLGLSGLHRPAKSIEKIGQGAQTVVLFDSSTSMDTAFFGSGNIKGGAASRVAAWGRYESKGQAARKLIGKFVSQRTQDLFAIFVFSRNPVPIMPLSNNQEVIQAAIKAGTYERGLGTTNLGTGMIRALEFFEDKPFKGSRVVLLVSDGAATLSSDVRTEIESLLNQHRVTLYWIYLRDRETIGFSEDKEENKKFLGGSSPERLVNKHFSNMNTPYRLFSADDPKALEKAIEEVNKLQKLPIRYTDTIPKVDLSKFCYGLALILLILLTLAKMSEIRIWR